MTPRLIVSRAHEVVQSLPLRDGLLVCVRCGLRGALADLFGSARCVPHIELASSGWLREGTP